ncbi:MAG: glycosyltransferase family 87 protein [Terriglobales bacterium]
MNSRGQQRKFLVAAFLLAMTICNVMLVVRLLPSLRNGFQDFTIFYTGARLIRNGQASALYDLAAQYRIQLTFAHVQIRQGPLPFNHPPFEALLFVPFTLLDYWPAYLLWTALNLIMLAVSVTVLSRHFRQLDGVPSVVLGLAATAFFPVAIGIIQGQDLVLLLLLFVLAVICLDKGSDAVAGALLAGGLFRPQLVVPLALLLAIRRWRVLIGFAPVALFLVGVSVAIMGWRGPLDYVRFVLHLEGTAARAFGPEAVPNIRGLVSEMPGLSASRLWTGMLILTLSLVVFFVALRRIRNGSDSIIFVSSLAVVTTILISFHALVYDLGLLLPMLFFLLSRIIDSMKAPERWSVLLAFLLFCSPLYMFRLLVGVNRFFWFSLIPLWIYLRLVTIPVNQEVPA